MMTETKSWACDVAVVSARVSTNGRPFIWKNYDCSGRWQQQIKYFSPKNPGPGGYLMLYHNDSWMQRINGSPMVPQAGVNEAGFAMALSSVYEDFNPAHELGNFNTDLMQHAVEECTTLEDFEALVKTWPTKKEHINHAISGNFVAIDAQGGAALYEMFTGYTTYGLMPIMYRKYDANTGRVTDHNGTQIQAAQSSFIGFVNRTNTHFWLPNNPGGERYKRGLELLTGLANTGALSPENMMHLVSRDITGKQTRTYSQSNYNTTYCISRSATRSGTVVEGVPDGGDPRLTTFWCALGEPSISVFVPYFASAHGVSPYAYADAMTITGEYLDRNDTCLLNMAEDYRETYGRLIYRSNRGNTIYGPYNNYINKLELAKVQAWTFEIENILWSNTKSYLNWLEDNSPDMSSNQFAQNLRGFADYCADFTYWNYTEGSSTAVPWTFPIP
ncbi:MAG TPA: hypothetical protein PKM41_12485 [Deltaproteobacteria bacterium]|jgi:hypothetical protein|nr:hypothetical protein [Deltaproteobacteria bacterium]